MEASTFTGHPAVSMIPMRHTKVVHFIRHAEGYHNVAGALDECNYESEKYADAHLTKKGWAQVAALRRHVQGVPHQFPVNLVVVSPLTRTLETAVGVFGGDTVRNSNGKRVLMKAQNGEEGVRVEHDAVLGVDYPPFVAFEDCREQSGQHPCDRRRTRSYYKDKFPDIDFSLIETEEDTLWEPQQRESRESILKRVRKFLDWLQERPEMYIAVVTHSAFLRNMNSIFGTGLDDTIREELQRQFKNCEMRTIMLFNNTGNHGINCPYSFSLPYSFSGGSNNLNNGL